MGSNISEIESKILAAIQKGLPMSQTPYKDLAEKVGIKSKELLEVLRDWQEQGKLRRIGAIVNHFKVGFSAGAMVAWRVDPERIEQVGQILAGFKQVSHAYEREISENWPYSIYTMVHGRDNDELGLTIENMSKACGVNNYRILTTERELKKSPPVYVWQSQIQDNEREE